MHPEYDLTDYEAESYCAGSENQRVRRVIAAIVCERSILDIGCGNGIDAQFYNHTQYRGVDWSPALIRAARKKNPEHRFTTVCADDNEGSLHFGNKAYCFTMLKSILEHQHSLEEALSLLSEAMRIGRETLVAWHTPPIPGLAEDQIRQVPGHFGRTVYQNTYRREPFLDLIKGGNRTIHSSVVDNFVLWRIT